MIGEYIIISTLALAFAITVMYQLFTRQLAPWVWRWDVCRILPSYRLFSSIPRDFRLYYRDRLQNGTLTPWQEIKIGLYSRWTWWHAVWHPQHLVPSVYTTLVDDMVRLAECWGESQHLASLEKTVIYQGLAHVIRHVSHDTSAVARQFKIEEAYGHVSTRSSQVVFVSAFHAL